MEKHVFVFPWSTSGSDLIEIGFLRFSTALNLDNRVILLLVLVPKQKFKLISKKVLNK